MRVLATRGWIACVLGCGRLGFDVAATHDTDPDAGGDVGNGGDGSSGACRPADLVVLLGFDEGTGATVGDASGLGNNGTLVGMDPVTDWVTGRAGTALDFDGVDDRVNAGSRSTVDDIVPITICAWVFPRSFPDQFPAIADKSTDTFIGGWNFYIENNNEFGFLTNRRKWITGGTVVLNTWTHLCATWDGTNGMAGIGLYQDGAVQVPNNSGSNGNQLDGDGAHDLLIGRVNNGTFPFDGRIDEVYVVRRVLADAEIAALHACGGG